MKSNYNICLLIILLLNSQPNFLMASGPPPQPTDQTTGQSTKEESSEQNEIQEVTQEVAPEIPQPISFLQRALEAAKTGAGIFGTYYITRFASTLAHELGHALAATMSGCTVKKVYVHPWQFTGYVMHSIPTSYSYLQGATISLAGPLAGMVFNYLAIKAANALFVRSNNQLCKQMASTMAFSGLRGYWHAGISQLIPAQGMSAHGTLAYSDGSHFLNAITSHIGESGYAISPEMIKSSYIMALLLAGVGSLPLLFR